MNNRRLLILIIVLSTLLLLLGGGLIATALYFQSRTSAAAAFSTPAGANALLTPIAAAGGPSVGAPAPDFTLNDLEGKSIQLSSMRGKPVLINFWATWCGPCSAEMPNIEKAYQQFKNDDIAILAVNQGEHGDQVTGYKDLYKLNFRILLDDSNQASRAYRIQALPTTIFVDRKGNIHEIHLGGPMSVDFIQSKIKELLATLP